MFSVAKPDKSGDKNSGTVAQVNVDREKKDSDKTGCKAKQTDSMILGSGDNSEWDTSPDLSLQEELQISDKSNETSDKDSVASLPMEEPKPIETEKEKDITESEKKNVQESSVALLNGRLFRKATEPMKPLNPSKKKRMATVTLKTSEKQHEEKPGPSSLDQRESKDCKKYVVRCAKKNESEHETIVTEDQEEIFRNAVKNTRQRQESVRINIGELVPEGEIKTSDITLNLVKGSEVELSLKYCPTDY